MSIFLFDFVESTWFLNSEQVFEITSILIDGYAAYICKYVERYYHKGRVGRGVLELIRMEIEYFALDRRIFIPCLVDAEFRFSELVLPWNEHSCQFWSPISRSYFSDWTVIFMHLNTFACVYIYIYICTQKMLKSKSDSAGLQNYSITKSMLQYI